MISPERFEMGTQPPSPALSFTSYSHLDLRKTQSHQDYVSGHVSQSEHASDVESVFSDAPILDESHTTAEHSLPTQNDHLGMPPPSLPARGRPTRRMRRFGAGSIGPRPLILPSASSYDHVPATAPALEYHEASPGFPFRDRSVGRRNGSPLMGRRRASTMMDQATLASLTGSTHLTVPRAEGFEDNTSGPNSPASVGSQSSTKDFSSLGSCTGAAISRNLLEELSQIRSNEMTEESIELIELQRDENESAAGDHEDETELQDSFNEPLEPIPESHSREVSDTTHSTATVVGLQSCSSAALGSWRDAFVRARRRSWGLP